MATMAPAPPGTTPTLTVGGVRRRTLLVGLLVAAVVAILGLSIAAISWIANYAPTVDTTATAVRPLDLILKQFDATSPEGDSFMEYQLAHEPGRAFSFVFWIHNDGPLPITLTHVSLQLPGVAKGEGVAVRPAGESSHALGSLPYEIPAHGYAEIHMSGRFVGCVSEGNGASFGSLPVSYELFGFVERHDRIELPMTISIRGQPGAHC